MTQIFTLPVLYLISGWLVRVLLQLKDFKSCESCSQYLASSTGPQVEEHLKSAAAFTSRLDQGGLQYPSEDVYLIACSAEFFFLKQNQSKMTIKDVSKELAASMARKFTVDMASMQALRNAPLCHGKELKQRLLTKFFTCRIRKVLRDAIQVKKGKTNVDYAGKTALMKTLVSKNSRRCILESTKKINGKTKYCLFEGSAY